MIKLFFIIILPFYRVKKEEEALQVCQYVPHLEMLLNWHLDFDTLSLHKNVLLSLLVHFIIFLFQWIWMFTGLIRKNAEQSKLGTNSQGWLIC